MQTRLAGALLLSVVVAPASFGQTNIDTTNKFAWAENCGWTNWRDANGGVQGVRVNPTFLQGFIWAENVGWINFNTQPQIAAQGARYDTVAGRFRGYAWGENIGWINLDDAVKFVSAVPVCCAGNADKIPGQVNFADITAVLQSFGLPANPDGSTPGDADCNGAVNFADITSVLQFFLFNCS